VRALVVTNMYPTPTAPSTGTFVAAQVESLRAAGVEIEMLHLTRRDNGRYVYRNLAQRMRDTVGESDPDVLHVMYGGVISEVATRAVRDRPAIVSFCGSDLLGGDAAGIVQHVATRYSMFASRRAAHRAAGIIVKARNLWDALPDGVDRTRVWIVPNGVDFAHFHPRATSDCRRLLGWTDDKRHVLFPANPQRPEKRFTLAEAAITSLNSTGFGRIQLHALTGIPHDQVPVWINAADAVILTSTHEGSPNVVKEALACNVPVVSTDVGDVRERLTGIEGCFVAEPTPADLAAKLALVFERRERVDARDRIADLALDAVARRIIDIYRWVLVGEPTAGRHD
jgi:glycosyltransferase involved in cell wall biosynthesis